LILRQPEIRAMSQIVYQCLFPQSSSRQFFQYPVYGFARSALLYLALINPTFCYSLTPTPASVNLTIHQFTEAKAVFTLRNPSSQTITVSAVQGSCACTSIELDEDTLPPGASTRLVATVRPGDRLGPFDSTVTVSWHTKDSNDAQTSQVLIHSTAVTLLHRNPSSLALDSLQAAEKAKPRTIQLTRGNATEKWDSLQVATSAPSLSATLAKKDADHYDLQVSLDTHSLPVGHFKGDLTLTCLDGSKPLEPAITIPVSAKIIGDLEAKPPTLYLGVVPPGEKKQLAARILAKDGKKLELIGIESSKPDFGTAIAETSSGTEIQLTCTFDPAHAKDNQSGRFLIRVKVSGKEETLALPFIAFVKGLETSSKETESNTQIQSQ